MQQDFSNSKGTKGRPLDPLNNPADLDWMHRLAYQRGWRINLKDGRFLNPDRLKLSTLAFDHLTASGQIKIVSLN